MRKQVLIMEMHKIREQCYDIYAAFNPGKELPKEQIDEAVKQIMTRFHNFTKLNQIDLQNSVTLFQYNLKHNKFHIDPLDMDSNSPEAISLQQKWDLWQSKKQLEKSLNASSPSGEHDTKSLNQSDQQLSETSKAFLGGTTDSDRQPIHPEISPANSEHRVPISEEQLLDAMKFEGMPKILYIYKEKIQGSKALLQQKQAKQAIYSSQFVDPAKIIEAQKEINELNETISSLTDEMYQIIDNMAFLSQLLQKLRSGLQIQLDHEEKRFLQRLVKGKAGQVFEALEQMNW